MVRYLQLYDIQFGTKVRITTSNRDRLYNCPLCREQGCRPAIKYYTHRLPYARHGAMGALFIPCKGSRVHLYMAG